jgi:hypothetical protein
LCAGGLEENGADARGEQGAQDEVCGSEGSWLTAETSVPTGIEGENLHVPQMFCDQFFRTQTSMYTALLADQRFYTDWRGLGRTPSRGIVYRHVLLDEN